MPPFQSEGPEKKNKGFHNVAPQRHVVPFGEEGEEDNKVVKRKAISLASASSKLKPFADEVSEGSESDPEAVDNGEATPSSFAIGWDTLDTFNKATAWTKRDTEMRAKAKVKRTYNNKNRAAAAATNPKRRRTGAFANNGADFGRIENLVKNKCKCARTLNTYSKFL